METLIVVPCYNEEARLDLAAVDVFLESCGGRFGFLFVDDGSRDGTLSMLNVFASTRHQASVLALGRNRGKAEAVRLGMQAACREEVEYVGYLDADLATPLSELPYLMTPFERDEALEIVMGSRVRLLGRVIERRPIRHYLGRIFATVASLLLRLPVYDTQCGAKIFRRTPGLDSLLADTFCTNWIFDVELLVRYLQAGGPAEAIFEQPLHQWRDIAGSHVGHRDFVRAGLELARLIRRYRLADSPKRPGSHRRPP